MQIFAPACWPEAAEDAHNGEGERNEKCHPAENFMACPPSFPTNCADGSAKWAAQAAALNVWGLASNTANDESNNQLCSNLFVLLCNPLGKPCVQLFRAWIRTKDNDEKKTNFGGLVLGCINADFYVKMLI